MEPGSLAASPSCTKVRDPAMHDCPMLENCRQAAAIHSFRYAKGLNRCFCGKSVCHVPVLGFKSLIQS